MTVRYRAGVYVVALRSTIYDIVFFWHQVLEVSGRCAERHSLHMFIYRVEEC